MLQDTFHCPRHKGLMNPDCGGRENFAQAMSLLYVLTSSNQNHRAHKLELTSPVLPDEVEYVTLQVCPPCRFCGPRLSTTDTSPKKNLSILHHLLQLILLCGICMKAGHWCLREKAHSHCSGVVLSTQVSHICLHQTELG